MANHEEQTNAPSFTFTRDDEVIAMLPLKNKEELLKRTNLTDEQVKEIITRMQLIVKHANVIADDTDEKGFITSDNINVVEVDTAWAIDEFHIYCDIPNPRAEFKSYKAEGTENSYLINIEVVTEDEATENDQDFLEEDEPYELYGVNSIYAPLCEGYAYRLL